MNNKREVFVLGKSSIEPVVLFEFDTKSYAYQLSEGMDEKTRATIYEHIKGTQYRHVACIEYSDDKSITDFLYSQFHNKEI